MTGRRRHLTVVPDPTPDAVPTGVWLGASYTLGRDVPVSEPYPHICQTNVTGRMTGIRFRTGRRDCAACQATPDKER